ncbi:MAG TPA: hypothetical protein VFZ61_24090 [Polyangiales bacterium]
MKRINSYLGVCALAGLLVSVGCSKNEDPETLDDAGQGGEEADAGPQDPGPCDTTWKAVQRTIFEGRGCTESACHGAKEKAGGLDLSPGVAYKNLVFADAEASLSVPLYRIHPGEQALSLLYLKVAAAVDEEAKLPAGAGAPMPTGKAPLSADQLAGLRLWIRAGAPETGVVEGTQELLGCDLPSEADPNRTIQPPVPDVEEGFQHASGTWTVPPDTDNEVCFATYYDLSDSAPDWARFPCELNGDSHTCVGFKRRQLSQDAQSHHSIINVYTGSASPTDPSWGAWRCVGGDLDQKACDPTKLGVSASSGGADCGADSACQSAPVKSIACRGYGPTDRDLKSVGAGGAQSPVSSQRFPEGVYGQLPIKGIIVWNSHGFNLTSKAADIGQFNTFWYARPNERTYLVRRIFDSRYIFTMTVPPFESREYCATFTLPRYANLANISSHAHKRGVLWRTWLPPNTPNCLPSAGCSPNAAPPDYVSKSYNDPLTIDYSPALTFDGEDEASRTLKYCAVFDNGKDHADLVKQRSKLLEGVNDCGSGQTFCLDGANKGKACASDGDCPGSSCDACTVTGGFTTEDEMFILLGDFFVVPPKP